MHVPGLVTEMANLLTQPTSPLERGALLKLFTKSIVMGTEIRNLHQFFSGNKLSKPQPFIQQDPTFFHIYGNQTASVSSNSSLEVESSSNDDPDIFSDISLSYISQMMMEEDDDVDNVQALEATEKPFYDTLGEKYPPPDSTPNSDSISTHSANSGGGGGGVVEGFASSSVRGRKNPHGDDDDLEDGRSIKQAAVSLEETIRSKDFDEVLLCEGCSFPKAISDLREALQNVVISMKHC